MSTLPNRLDLPGNNPAALIDELKRQLDSPAVHAFLHDHGDGAIDITFRTSRRRIIAGPRFGYTPFRTTVENAAH